jgi:cytochrome c5
MKKKSAVFSFAGSVILLLACSPKLMAPTAQQITQVQQRDASLKAEQLTAGYELYRGRCNKCHGLYNPASFDQTKWDTKILPSMSKKAKLTDDELSRLKVYLFAFSQDKQIQ